MIGRANREEAIFAAALAIGDRRGRAAYLGEACGGGAELRRGVDQLRPAPAAQDTLARAFAALPVTCGGAGGATVDRVLPPFAEPIGTLIGGRYKLLEQRSEEHTSELQSRLHLVCRLLLEKKKKKKKTS